MRADLERLSAGGTTWLRWFVLCDGRAGIRFDTSGTPLGLDDHVRADLDVALRLAHDTGLKLVLTLFDFHWCAPMALVGGVQTGGRRAVITSAARRDALLRTVLEPLVEHVGSHPAVAAWDAMNEPEWATFGLGTWDPRRAVRRSTMRQFLGEIVAIVRARAPHPVTVGSASADWLALVRGLGLDFYQVHWYDHMAAKLPLARPVASFALDRPVVLGEFPTRGSHLIPSAVVDVARSAGYAGSWFWSVQAEDAATDLAAAMVTFGGAPSPAPDPTAAARI